MSASRSTEDSNHVLSASGLAASVILPGKDRLDVLRGVDFAVHRGESVAIVGQSGSGKSTLLAILGMLARPASGHVVVNGRNASGMSDAQITRTRNREIGFVFQSYSLVRHMTARANVELPLRYGTRLPRRQRRERVDGALELVELSNRRRSRPIQLSGGEQQRVAIARALVREPSILLADEPTGALDVKTADKVLDALVAVTRQRACALVVVTHDPSVAERMTRVLHLQNGMLEP